MVRKGDTEKSRYCCYSGSGGWRVGGLSRNQGYSQDDVSHDVGNDGSHGRSRL